jgi:long-chain acyl-CoA synthetase
VTAPGAATHCYLTPTALARLLDRDVPLAGRVLVVAGDRLSTALRDRAVRAGGRVQHYYGAAELSFVAWGSCADDLRAFPGVEVAVRTGEVWVRSPYLCTGYAGPPGPLRRDARGFATVGDRGVLTGGVLTVAGRTDAVQVAGSTVEPGGVEDLLRRHARGEVAVVGVPHPVLGTVLGVVLTEPGDHAVLRSLARERLQGAERPRLWFALDGWPTTPAGKLDRVGLVALLTGRSGRARRLV